MTTTTVYHQCRRCEGTFEAIHASGHSTTVQCRECQHCTLIFGHPAVFMDIPLLDFHLKRGDLPSQRPLDDIELATQLVEGIRAPGRLVPSRDMVIEFGIDSPSHLSAIAYALSYCVRAYDLDRVMGDGRAITRLVRNIPYQPCRKIEFRTAYDDGTWRALQS